MVLVSGTLASNSSDLVPLRTASLPNDFQAMLFIVVVAGI